MSKFDINQSFSRFLSGQMECSGIWYEWCSNLACHHERIAHGHWPAFQSFLDSLPEAPEHKSVLLDDRWISVYDLHSSNDIDQDCLRETLKKFTPWRKGSFSLLGVEIDGEWRSDLKWDRIKDFIQPLSNRKVLDVGSGNGYHLWRMLGAGARVAVGVDPTILSIAQFHAVYRLLGEAPIWIVPTTLENLDRRPLFDSVFSMGVLYHRRSPISHLQELWECLCPGGELILETLVISGNDQACLIPVDRYAGMRNVWFIPSVEMIFIWLFRVGFTQARLVSLDTTTSAEQRRTEWLGDKPSLIDVLDPSDMSRTIEGYPAPLRAVVIAEKPLTKG